MITSGTILIDKDAERPQCFAHAAWQKCNCLRSTAWRHIHFWAFRTSASPPMHETSKRARVSLAGHPVGPVSRARR